MPEMDGLEALKIIKRDFPYVQVIMISSGGPDSALTTVEALEKGAFDFIMKPSEASMEKNMEMIKNHLQMLFTQIQIKKYSNKTNNKPAFQAVEQTTAKQLLTSTPQVKIQPAEAKFPQEKRQWIGADLIVIASSTGGPNALESIFKGFTSTIPKPMLIVQHMPPEFTKMLAQSLNKSCALNIYEGQINSKITAGEVIIAPGGLHMTVETINNSIKVVKTESTPFVNGVRPAADVLFRSVAKEYAGKNILAVILTGMGSDGMLGVAEIKKSCNCYCLTQSEASSVVYGMPRSAYEAGLSDEVADLKDIADRIKKLSTGRS